MEAKVKKAAFYTLGCKVNQYETHSMMQMFKEANYELVGFEDVADVYVINTCTVTNISDRKSRKMIRKVKEISPNSTLCVVGCYAQVASEELGKIKEIDIILGTNDKKNIIEYIDKFNNVGADIIRPNESNKKEEKKNIKPKLSIVHDIMEEREYKDYGKMVFPDRVRAEIKIQDGCDRYCTYCIIPYARGPVRSRKMNEIINEAITISKMGVKEVVITGIHISSYGKDLSDKPGLIDLLENLNAINSIDRIRLGSLEPGIITEEFILRIKKLNKVCKHFHLSLQSGCNQTLKRMNRRYTVEEFKQKVDMLRYNIEGVALTTDVIVGFPGETEEEFIKTYEFLKEINFSKMHIFKYSPRKGTPAATYENQINGAIKEKRSQILIELSDKFEKEFAEKYIENPVEVLFENPREGYTSNYIMVKDFVRKHKIGVEMVIPKKYENGVLVL
jgi:threonylcarbamoyladenosine tRNA methylthiotransferase MtaB